MAGPLPRTAPRGVTPTWDDVVEGQPVDATTEEALWAERVIANRLERYVPSPRETEDAETLFGQLEAAAPDDTELRQALDLQRRFLGLRGVPGISAPDMTFVPEREHQRWRDKAKDRDLTDQAEEALPRHYRSFTPQPIQHQTPSQSALGVLMPTLPTPAPATGRYLLSGPEPARVESAAGVRRGRMAPSRMRYKPNGGE